MIVKHYVSAIYQRTFIWLRLLLKTTTSKTCDTINITTCPKVVIRWKLKNIVLSKFTLFLPKSEIETNFIFQMDIPKIQNPTSQFEIWGMHGQNIATSILGFAFESLSRNYQLSMTDVKRSRINLTNNPANKFNFLSGITIHCYAMRLKWCLYGRGPSGAGEKGDGGWPGVEVGELNNPTFCPTFPTWIIQIFVPILLALDALSHRKGEKSGCQLCYHTCFLDSACSSLIPSEIMGSILA